MEMTDGEFGAASRAITVTVIEAMAGAGATADDAAAVIGFALFEALGQLLGSPIAAIERMRTIADIGEAQILGLDPVASSARH